jgi:ectoine hydroxylase-related dioxygenase (phytanoyl-CoA dioxygenase family)
MQEHNEIRCLRSEIQKLRARLSVAESNARLADRDGEYRRRMASLGKLAGDAAEPGDREFGQLIALVTAVAAQVHTEGYAVVPNLLNSEQVRRMRDGLGPLFAVTQQLYDSNPRHGGHGFHIHNVFAKSRAADEVAVNPVIRAIVGAVLGYDFILNAGAIVMSPPPGCCAQKLHRDDGFYSMLTRPHPPVVLTVAIALDQFTRENGATRFVPRSCCWPSSRLYEAEEVLQCEMSAGSVLVWDGAIYHGGGANLTKNQTRRTLAFNYTRGCLRTQYNQYLSIPRALLLSMPAELQRQLGYEVSGRGLGGCDNQAPLAYLRRMFEAGGDGAQATLGPENDLVPPHRTGHELSGPRD